LAFFWGQRSGHFLSSRLQNAKKSQIRLNLGGFGHGKQVVNDADGNPEGPVFNRWWAMYGFAAA